MIARAALLVGGVLLLAPAASSGQTRFQIAAGAHYGMNQTAEQLGRCVNAWPSWKDCSRDSAKPSSGNAPRRGRTAVRATA